MLYDKDIREPLFEFLEGEYGRVRILEEKNMGDSRADVVMVSQDALFGIEIKSDADTYVRLSGQVKDYDKYFDYNYVVVGTSHANSIEDHVPEYWGIITVEEDKINTETDFYILRRPKPNPKMKWDKKLKLLWKPELSIVQEKNNMPRYKQESKDFCIKKIMERLYETIEPNDLRHQISEILFERDYTNIKSMLNEYRKSETEKLLEKETDPEKRAQLIAAAAKRAQNLPKPRKRYRRRRRKQS